MLICSALLVAAVTLQEGVPVVEPPDLDRRADLIGREVAVDGRVRLFQFRPGRGFDEILLHGTDAILRLPPNLRYERAPSERVVSVRGVLKMQGKDRVLEVSAIQLLPEDRDRLAQAVARLAPGDTTTLRAWTRWATRRASLYQDEELRADALKLEDRLIRQRAEALDARNAEGALALADEARSKGLPEPLPSAIAHRGLAAEAREAGTPEQLDDLAKDVLARLPGAERPGGDDPVDWLAPYANDPYRAYLQAPQGVRTALDRRLYADLVERSLNMKAEANPKNLLRLADEAARRLPDRPGLADTLRNRGLEVSALDVAQLRRADVLNLAANFEQVGQPQRGRELVRAWLQDLREHRLGRGEIDGRLALAEDYLELANDRATAVELLREAAGIDPSSKPVAEAFRRLGFRREGAGWDEVASSSTEPDADPISITVRDDPILGLSPDEVQARLGRPDRRSQCVTQGRVTIQWVYDDPRGRSQVINFLKQPGFPPRAVSRYTP